MREAQQLSARPAAEGLGQPSLEGKVAYAPKQESIKAGLNTLPARPKNDSSSSPSHQPSKVEKRTRKVGLSVSGPYLHPLPTIETLMTYPSLSRPVYDSLVRGEPPAQSYKTVIHTPKPPNMRVLDQNLLRAAEVQAYRRRKRANSGPRARSNTASSTASSVSAYSSNASSVDGDAESSASDVSEPSSPASASSTSKATVSSSTTPSPRYSLFPSLPADPHVPLLAPIALSPTRSVEGHLLDSYSNPSSRSPSPAQSFHSTHSTVPSHCDSSSDHSSRSSAPSPASSAYPSPPASPEISRRSSSSGEEFMAYPSPPPSPGPSHQSQPASQRPELQHRERRAFSFPPPPTLSEPPHPTLRRRSASLNSHPWTHSDALEFDLGEQRLGGGELYEDEDEQGGMDWSMNGGEVVFGAAGVALSPRAMQGSCCHCEHASGLGLYVIDEEEECIS